jgi:cytidylate kinase
MSAITILTGSPGTGKTTVAALLAKAKPRGLHIPADVFYTFPAYPISPYRPAALEQNTDIIVAVTQTAATLALRGYTVTLDGIFGPWFLGVILDSLGPTDLVLSYVILQAPLEIALRRVRDRIGHEKDHVVRQLHHAFADLGPYAKHAVDTASREAAAVAAWLGPAIDRGEFVLS